MRTHPVGEYEKRLSYCDFCEWVQRTKSPNSINQKVGARSDDHLFTLFTYYLCYEMSAWVQGVLVRVECVGKYESSAWVKYEK